MTGCRRDPRGTTVRKIAPLLLHRTGGHPEDRVERAGRHQARRQRDDADEVEPAIGPAAVEKEPGQQPEAEEDAQRAVDGSDVFLEHGVTFVVGGARRAPVHEGEYAPKDRDRSVIWSHARAEYPPHLKLRLSLSWSQAQTTCCNCSSW